MSWFDVDLTLTTFFTPIPDDQAVCAEADGTRVCVPFSGRPIAQAVGSAVGGSYVLANDAETLGGIFRAAFFIGGGNRHWQVGGGASVGFLAAFDAVDVSIEAGYNAFYLAASGVGSTDFSELLHTLSASVAIGGRLSPSLKVFVAPQILIPFGGEDGVRADAVAMLLSVGAAFAIGRKPVSHEVASPPDPDEEARAAAVRAALAEAQIRLQRARQHLEPGWFAAHVQERIKQSPGEPPVAVEIKALRDCAAWVQQSASGRQWPSAGRLSLQSLREAIAASMQTVLAGSPSAEQRKIAGDVLEASDNIARDTATMLAAWLRPDGPALLLPHLIAWGRELKTAIGKSANGDRAALDAQLLDYGRAIFAYQETLNAVMPFLPSDSATLQDTLSAVGCLNDADALCKERFDRLLTEPFDPTISAMELSNQLEKKRNR